MLATAPSCCVPSRNQMMVAAGLALKALHVRLWGVPACSRITGPPSILVSSGGTGGKRRTESAQDAAQLCPPAMGGVLPSACVPLGRAIPPSPNSQSLYTVLTKRLHPAHKRSQLAGYPFTAALSLRTHHCYSRGPTSDGGLSQVLS